MKQTLVNEDFSTPVRIKQIENQERHGSLTSTTDRLYLTIIRGIPNDSKLSPLKNIH